MWVEILPHSTLFMNIKAELKVMNNVSNDMNKIEVQSDCSNYNPDTDNTSWDNHTKV